MKRSSYRTRAVLGSALALVLLALPYGALAEGTHINPPSNRYSPSDDVQVGQQAAQEAEQQLPILRDAEITNYVNDVGQRLVRAIPEEYQHPEFRYSFRVVNAKEVNAFALPGGPMYVNSGMIMAARNEGEMAGVMAHELSHVALRHGTAQATKAQKYSILGGVGAILGGVIGGGVGSVIGQGSQTAVGVYFLKFSREYETQADILGAQIMARAGYDPRDLANMFRTIAQQGGGSGGPEWLSSHPNPGNREQRIMQEAAMLRVEGGRGDSAEFRNVQSRLRGYPRARTMEEIARSGQRNPNQGGQYPDQRNPNDGNYPNQNDDYARGERVAYPSTRYQTQRTNLFSVAVPSNWQQVNADQSSVWYAPAGAYGSQGITHGIILSVAQTQSGDLGNASREIVNGLLQGENNYLRQAAGFQRTVPVRRTMVLRSLKRLSPASASSTTGRRGSVASLGSTCHPEARSTTAPPRVIRSSGTAAR